MILGQEDGRSIIPLWRSSPPATAESLPLTLIEEHSEPHAACVFPSARQAIVQVLKREGVKRSDRVVIPEWSSHCVISAVARVATPTSVGDALVSRNDCTALLVYEQWGWKLSDTAIEELSNIFRASTIILDRVDTASLEKFSYSEVGYEIWSLSKTLGFYGAGIVRGQDGQWLRARTAEVSTHSQICRNIPSNHDLNTAIDVEIFRTYSDKPDPRAVAWVSSMGIGNIYCNEAVDRQERAAILIEAIGSEILKVRLGSGKNASAPGLFPLGLGASKEKRKQIESVCTSLGIETRQYHFDVRGRPAAPEYRPCVAVPIHGGVPLQTLELLIDQLMNIP